MARTRNETVETLELVDQPGASPAVDGQVIYADGGFLMRDSVGTFDPRSGSGLSEALHRGLDTLVHLLAQDGFGEPAYSGPLITSFVVWTDNGKTQKIREGIFTYTGILVTTIVINQYDSGGTLKETLTGTLTYSGVLFQNATWVLT